MNFLKSIQGMNPFAVRNSLLPDSGTPVLSPYGTQWSGKGTNPGELSLRSLQDMKPADRRESMKRSRFITNRLGLGRALIEGTTRYAIGSGLMGYSATGDKAFDDACNRFCDAILEADTEDTRMEVTGLHNFYTMQELVCPEMMTDGDCGVAKILQGGWNAAGVRPQLQLFASDQITDNTFMTTALQGGARWRDGVLRDQLGRALRYRVQVEQAPGYPGAFPAYQGQGYHEFSAQDFLLIFDPKRIGQGRGMPWLHHGQESSITMMDLKKLEEGAAYLNAFWTAVITTESGEMPDAVRELASRRNGKKVDEKADGTTEELSQVRRYANLMGGAWVPVLKAGEKIEMVKSDRPSLTFTGFMDWLVNDIAWGFGVPPSFVWAIAGRSGPETRLTLNQADWFFQMVQRRMISRFCQPVRDFVVRFGLLRGYINDGRLPRNGASPFKCRWRGPRKVTIDERYFVKTEIERMEKGYGTEEEFYSQLGMDADEMREKRVQEAADWMRLCDKHGVPYERVRPGMPGQNTGSDVVQDPQAGNEPQNQV